MSNVKAVNLAVLCLSLAACKPEATTQPAAPAAVDAGAAAKKGDEAAPPEYVLKGDLPELQKKGYLRVLVPAQGERLQRAGNPNAVEHTLAKKAAEKLGLKAVFVEVASYDDLFKELDLGHGDLVAASMSITAERQEKVAFTRPLRFVKEQLVVKAGDDSVKALADLEGKEVTVRESSAYATTLNALQAKQVKGLKVGKAAETEDTYTLIQRVARGELKYTVADNDILTDALTFEPGVKAALDLTEKDPIGWALRKTGSAELKGALDSFLIESAMTSFKDNTYKADLDDIVQKDVLRVLTRNTATTYFIYRGEQLGFEYELMKDFAKSQGVRLELVIPPDREALARYLAEGKGDLVAAGLTVTDERKKEFDFSSAYNHVSELLVVPVKDTASQSIADFKGKKIAVRKSSSYFESLTALKEKNGFEIELVPETMETEEILEAVADGKYAATVADSNIVEVELTYADKLRSVGPLGAPKDLGWMIRKDQPKLKAALDAYIKKNYKGLFYNMMVNKYFKNAKQMAAATSSDRSDVKGKISEWDGLAKKYATMYEFDWRLVLAQMYQESHFDVKAKSWVGALGLMQVMPGTAKDLKIADVTDPDQGVQAGVKLMARYANLFNSPKVKEKDRLRFALAAYNCGPGHVYDARRIAEDMKLDPNKWFKNVEKAMLALSKPEYAKKARYGYCRCTEPVNYVSEIQTRYDSYSKLVDLK
jgi:membrane-bound lytic murein transglycosylase F